MAKNSSPSRAPKNGAQRQCELTELEKCRISLRKTIKRQAAMNTAILLEGILFRFPVRTCAWIPTFT